MPDVDIMIGGRNFQVSCQPGEEHYLRSAAQLLDAEAQPLVAQLGRIPEVRLLLMAGLMLADKTAAVEDENRTLRGRLAEAEDRGARVEVPALPRATLDALAALVATAERVADRAEDVT